VLAKLSLNGNEDQSNDPQIDADGERRSRLTQERAACLKAIGSASICVICGFYQKNLPHLLRFLELKDMLS
jgi:hypothetical protein